MKINKELKNFGMAWEEGFAYSQAVKVGDTIYLSGQISHDESGETVGIGDMEAQLRQCYANVAALLAQYGATLENVVDETMFVTDMEAALAAASCRREFFPGAGVALTAVEVKKLAFPDLLVEIKCVAKV